ncbi:hypothetical protein SBA6_1270002 [Candidatus Sulfopaludibacter sp. SbA6]|nr:hypothetical protein SBA6_1270002 [Candidatus Sulfopaludibacter sp. SbA6]
MPLVPLVAYSPAAVGDSRYPWPESPDRGLSVYSWRSVDDPDYRLVVGIRELVYAAE